MIGTAVNEAARLEGLTKTLGVPVVASAKFADATEENLVGLGAHKVRASQTSSKPSHCPKLKAARLAAGLLPQPDREVDRKGTEDHRAADKGGG